MQLLAATRRPDRPGLVAKVSLELAFDRRRRERRKLEIAPRVEPFDRFEQADERDLPQVVELLTAIRETTREVGGEPLVSFDQFVPELPLARSPIFDELRSLQFPRIGIHAREPPTRAGVSSRSKHSPRRSQSCMCREMRRGFDGSGCRAR